MDPAAIPPRELARASQQRANGERCDVTCDVTHAAGRQMVQPDQIGRGWRHGKERARAQSTCTTGTVRTIGRHREAIRPPRPSGGKTNGEQAEFCTKVATRTNNGKIRELHHPSGDSRTGKRTRIATHTGRTHPAVVTREEPDAKIRLCDCDKKLTAWSRQNTLDNSGSPGSSTRCNKRSP